MGRAAAARSGLWTGATDLGVTGRREALWRERLSKALNLGGRALRRQVKAELAGCESVLDLGCGRSSILQDIPPLERSVGVEAHRPALEESRRRGVHTEYIAGDARHVEFSPGSFDAVIMMDLLEHLDPSDGTALLSKVERIALKRVVVFTPNGFVRQDEYDSNPLQVHRSGWTVESFGRRGYMVYGIGGLRALRGERAVPRHPRVVTRPLASLSQPTVFRRPSHAFHLLAIRRGPTG